MGVRGADGARRPSRPQKLTAGHESELCCRKKGFSMGSRGWEPEMGAPGDKVGVPVPAILVATARTEDTENAVHSTPQRDTRASYTRVRCGLTTPLSRSSPSLAARRAGRSRPRATSVSRSAQCMKQPLPGSLPSEFPGLQGSTPDPAQFRGRGSRRVEPAWAAWGRGVLGGPWFSSVLGRNPIPASPCWWFALVYRFYGEGTFKCVEKQSRK